VNRAGIFTPNVLLEPLLVRDLYMKPFVGALSQGMTFCPFLAPARVRSNTPALLSPKKGGGKDCFISF